MDATASLQQSNSHLNSLREQRNKITQTNESNLIRRIIVVYAAVDFNSFYLFLIFNFFLKKNQFIRLAIRNDRLSRSLFILCVILSFQIDFFLFFLSIYFYLNFCAKKPKLCTTNMIIRLSILRFVVVLSMTNIRTTTNISSYKIIIV